MDIVDKTGVFNLAVLSLGQTAPIITADGDNTLTARILRQWWDRALSKTLRKTDWRCYRKKAALQLVSDNYSEQWKYKYKVNSDCAQVLAVDYYQFFPNWDLRPEAKIQFESIFEGANIYILTNVRDAWAMYTRAPANGEGIPSYFAEALSLVLAELAAPGLITNNWARMKDAFLKDAKIRISECIAEDIGDQPQPRRTPSSFEAARCD